MFVVTVEVVLKEDVIEELRSAFLAMDKASAEEAGCIKYVSSADVHDPRIIRIYEEWESMDALTLHFKTPHMTEFQKVFASVEASSMQAKVYEISRELPFPN
ncbi:Autoinducer 2-degrading protein LsrG [Ruegeria denitrificans]|uniref:Autoinducer 2-degrading protein LsrG n=1 Tax=Ruegeria denitrificans TaxID=1715692 RepID=A0A0P1IAL6_9RHOB|nr:putative quinol monooxygenase [Ruegeria denitrificans]CUK01562.1 Autoinducer 2-degrading protein LsrG [Ruegeria denitrificans]